MRRRNFLSATLAWLGACYGASFVDPRDVERLMEDRIRFDPSTFFAGCEIKSVSYDFLVDRTEMVLHATFNPGGEVFNA